MTRRGSPTCWVGLFGTFRNVPAHAPRLKWAVDEREALDALTIISYAHRRLDEAVPVRHSQDLNHQGQVMTYEEVKQVGQHAYWENLADHYMLWFDPDELVPSLDNCSRPPLSARGQLRQLGVIRGRAAD